MISCNTSALKQKTNFIPTKPLVHLPIEKVFVMIDAYTIKYYNVIIIIFVDIGLVNYEIITGNRNNILNLYRIITTENNLRECLCVIKHM